MTGADVKQKAIVTLRSHVWNMPSPEAAEEACAEALAALYPCIVLTADEATIVRRAVDVRGGAARRALALLAPEKDEPDPVIPGYGSSI